jgi:hypothetical protein
MERIKDVAGLRQAIQSLEAEQEVKAQLLKEQFRITSANFKPLNLLKSSVSDLASSPYLVENIIGTSIGLATGFLAKKVFIGASGNVIRKLFGSVLQFGVTNLFARHPDSVTSIGQNILRSIFLNKAKNSPGP